MSDEKILEELKHVKIDNLYKHPANAIEVLNSMSDDHKKQIKELAHAFSQLEYYKAEAERKTNYIIILNTENNKLAKELVELKKEHENCLDPDNRPDCEHCMGVS